MTNSSRSRSLDARIMSVRSADTFALRRLAGGSLISFLAIFGNCGEPSPDRLTSPESRNAHGTTLLGHYEVSLRDS
jgi:hypothetical protein